MSLALLHFDMLSRRIFQQVTDSILLGPGFRPLCSRCVSFKVPWFSSHRGFVPTAVRYASSSSTRWKSRQGKDFFAKAAKLRGLKSRAAYKLIDINEQYKLFKPGQTVVDLGYAPGSWSQVAATYTSPNGRVIGIDMIPAQPPRGVSTIQGNFLSPAIQAEVRAYVRDPNLGRPRKQSIFTNKADVTEQDLEDAQRGYIDFERKAHLEGVDEEAIGNQNSKETDTESEEGSIPLKERDRRRGRVVDVVLSDMMMNTSGMAFRDHAGSMDLCMAALTFCFDSLRTGGHFVCKFYQGSEDKEFEKRLRKLFQKVHREKPESSRSESREAFFVALRRRELPTKEEVFQD